MFSLKLIQGFLWFRRLSPTSSAHLLHLLGNRVAFQCPSFLLCEMMELEKEWLPGHLDQTLGFEIFLCCSISQGSPEKLHRKDTCVCVCACVCARAHLHKDIRNLIFVCLEIRFSEKEILSWKEIYFKELGHTIVGLAGLKSACQVRGLETQEWFPRSSLEAEFLLPLETWVFALKAFSWLGEDHPHYGE